MPRSRYQALNGQYPHFLTATINNWLPVFTCPETVNIVLDSWRYLQREANLKIYCYVILENHLHLVARSDDITRDMKRFKSYTALEIVKYLERARATRLLELLARLKRPHKTESLHQVWEEGNHPQLIETEAVMRQKLEYIR